MQIKLLDDNIFEVILDNTFFKVSLGDKYYESLVKKLSKRLSKKKLIEASFRFLLDRESKNLIFREFDVKIINNYFPDFESEIGNYL